jgi:hypothetical protein
MDGKPEVSQSDMASSNPYRHPIKGESLENWKKGYRIGITVAPSVLVHGVSRWRPPGTTITPWRPVPSASLMGPREIDPPCDSKYKEARAAVGIAAITASTRAFACRALRSEPARNPSNRSPRPMPTCQARRFPQVSPPAGEAGSGRRRLRMSEWRSVVPGTCGSRAPGLS